ncbi:hypothetical protein EB118_03890 [bacterium]|nr:hypothetical protein [bacterium]NBX98150.1 hypothetical protein [bacterium]NDC94493.1 hypothetical protein [bacterium]NDD84480.1 hypothetical protein [bacterium]NDG29227.1 hypothetical protein [bacterium]
MEYASRFRVALFSLFGLILLVLSIWGVIAIAQSVFKPNNSTKVSTDKKLVLTDFARSNTAVSVEASGPIVGDENYISYNIEVTDSYRQITTFIGYQRRPTNTKKYDNNSVAYQAFLRALERNNFLTSLRIQGDDDGLAACPSGNRYAYILKDQNEQISRLWSTSCTGRQGTMGGASAAVRSLFRAQIPDYTTILSNQYASLQ